MSTPDEILGAAMSLTEAERTQLALGLLDTIGPPDPLAKLSDDEWLDELNRRAERAASGQSTGTSWPDARKRIERKLGA